MQSFHEGMSRVVFHIHNLTAKSNETHKASTDATAPNEKFKCSRVMTKEGGTCLAMNAYF